MIPLSACVKGLASKKGTNWDMGNKKKKDLQGAL